MIMIHHSPEALSEMPLNIIERRIYLIRDHKVMLDKDLAELYQVETRSLNQAVRRNSMRFPEDFAFQLTQEEFDDLRSQNVISSHGGRRYVPYAFTEQGVAMLSSVLHSERAVHVNIAIMRAFVRLRGLIANHQELSRKIHEHDSKIEQILELLDRLLNTPPIQPNVPSPPVGFGVDV